MRSPNSPRPQPKGRPATLVVVGLLLAVMFAVVGCEEKPSAPDFNNPFDPDVPGSDDPLNLQAIFNAGPQTITLFWDQPQGFDIVEYDVTHTDDPDAGFSFVATVEATDATQGIYTFTDPVANAANYFIVQARNSAGDVTLLSQMTPAVTATPPFLTVGDDSGDAPSRFTTLTVTTSIGDTMRIGDNPAFEGAVSLPAYPDSSVNVDWDLGPAGANGEQKSVYLIVDTAGVPSDTAQATVEVDFAPNFTAVGDPPTLAGAVIDLTVAAAGALQMRFAADAADLPGEPWVPIDTLYTGYQLADTINPQTVYGEFESDFGFTAQSEYLAVPDDLSGASFQLDLPEDRVVSTSTLTVLNDAVALLMRFAASPDFQGVAWQDYTDTATVTIGTDPGTHVVYGQFRNHWADSAVLTDYAILVAQQLEVTILAPQDGAAVRGGSALEMRGTSLAPNGGTVDSVKVDTGDGLVSATGTSDWTYLWDVPRLAVDTERILRARAYAGDDSATTTVTVTITQLTVTITAPDTGALLDAETETEITGNASPAIGGAAVDSVVVDVGDTHLSASGTDTWTVSWTTPAVTEPTGFTIVATAYAGGDAAADSVAVIVQPTGLAD
jgi:hypothetical protein